MKVPPLNLNPDINRVGMALPFSPDLLWRYPLSLQQSALAPPSSPLLDVKNQMPNHLAVDPRMWSRDDVSTFLRWFEREFELPKIDSTKFCMNGKALCMLTKSDLAERAPGAGDVLHNTLQFLLRDAPQVPPSPLTPHHPLLSPSPLSSTPSQPWSLAGSDFHSLGHLLQQGGSVTLSPAPSEQSGGSPRHPESNSVSGAYHHSSSASTGSTHSGSHSDSEDSTRDSSSPQRSPVPPHSAASSFSAQALASLKHLTDYQRAAAAAAVAAAQNNLNPNYEDIKPQYLQQTDFQRAAAVVAAAATAQNNMNPNYDDVKPQYLQKSDYQRAAAAAAVAAATVHNMNTNYKDIKPQYLQQPQHQPPQPLPNPPQQQQQPSIGDEPVETGTNGRLLWDFLQQLLNDGQQRYSSYIAWKNRDTGVFKIVDPPGLARLWGIQKNHLSMNYDKMSRALRYYYRVNILRKVQGERHCYQFLRNPSELKSIKNISLLRGTPLPVRNRDPPANTAATNVPTTTATPMEEDEGPTDLTMATLHHLRIFSNHESQMDQQASQSHMEPRSSPLHMESQGSQLHMESQGSQSHLESQGSHSLMESQGSQSHLELQPHTEPQPQNLTVDRQEIKTETFSETFE